MVESSVGGEPFIFRPIESARLHFVVESLSFCTVLQLMAGRDGQGVRGVEILHVQLPGKNDGVQAGPERFPVISLLEIEMSPNPPTEGRVAVKVSFLNPFRRQNLRFLSQS